MTALDPLKAAFSQYFQRMQDAATEITSLEKLRITNPSLGVAINLKMIDQLDIFIDGVTGMKDLFVSHNPETPKTIKKLDSLLAEIAHWTQIRDGILDSQVKV